MRAALVFVAMLIVGVLFALSLGGCATQGGLRGTGEIAPPPVGWLEHCLTVPIPDECAR